MLEPRAARPRWSKRPRTALDQARVAYVDYDVAVVTNVTHEHLDWHGSWENYMAAKARLFDALSDDRAQAGHRPRRRC